MGKVETALREEIARLARKEIVLIKGNISSEREEVVLLNRTCSIIMQSTSISSKYMQLHWMPEHDPNK